MEAFEEARVAQEAAEAAATMKAQHAVEKYDLNAEAAAAQLASIKLEDMLYEWQLN